jgi:hypothetical protein
MGLQRLQKRLCKPKKNSVRVNSAPQGFFATSFFLLLVAAVVGASMVLMADCPIEIFRASRIKILPVFC